MPSIKGKTSNILQQPDKKADSIQILAKINRSDIVYVGGLIESYDNIAVMRTINAEEGIVEFLVAPAFLDDMKSLLSDLYKDTGLTII